MAKLIDSPHFDGKQLLAAARESLAVNWDHVRSLRICPKKPRSQQFSGFSSEMGVANSAVMTCPETLNHQLKRCWFETVSILHAVETCTRN